MVCDITLCLFLGGKCIWRLPLRPHANMRVMFQHPVADVTGDVADGLITRPAFGQFCDGVVPGVVESQPCQRAGQFADVSLPRFFGNLRLQEGSLILDKGETFKVRLFIDASVLEVFANGRVSLGDRVYPSNPDGLGIGLFAKGGTAHLKSLTLWELNPISPDRMTSGAELFKV